MANAPVWTIVYDYDGDSEGLFHSEQDAIDWLDVLELSHGAKYDSEFTGSVRKWKSEKHLANHYNNS